MTLTEPANISRLPRDKHNRPIPWFVHIDDAGVPDFRVIRHRGIHEAYTDERCWVCGQHRGRYAAFVVGPMCAVNRISSEPPSHRDCAIYSAQVCPFLATPTMRRRERGLPEDRHDPAGIHITRNPGAALVWITREWQPASAPGGVLFELGEPTDLFWYTHGREATPDEINTVMASGIPILRAQAEEDGPHAVELLDRQLETALSLLPAGADTP